MFYARLLRLIGLYQDRDDEGGSWCAFCDGNWITFGF
jgi:hypothetical protein